MEVLSKEEISNYATKYGSYCMKAFYSSIGIYIIVILILERG